MQQLKLVQMSETKKVSEHTQKSSISDEPKEKVVEVKDNKNRVVKTITNNGLMWGKINAWLESCKQQKENFAYFVVEYRADVHLDGTKDESLSVSTTLERPFKPEGDSYGGCWGCGGSFNKDELDKLKSSIINWRKDFLETPYCKEKADGTALRDIKAENIRVFIADEGKDFINRTASWNMNDLAAELKAIKEAPLTDGYIKKFDRMKFLDKEIHRIEYEVIPELKKKIESFFQQSGQSTLENKPDLNHIAEIMSKNKCSLKQMEREYCELRKEMYRWGK